MSNTPNPTAQVGQQADPGGQKLGYNTEFEMEGESLCLYVDTTPLCCSYFYPVLYKDLNSLWMEQIDCHFIITALSGTAAAIILLVFRMQSSIPSKKKIIAPINSSF